MMSSSSLPIALSEATRLNVGRELFERKLIVGFDSHDGRSRPFNLLRTQVLRHVDQNGSRMLGMTSATPAAGKTFVSFNLAAALSQIEGRQVVLCDFDLRRGSILDLLDAEVPIDVSSYLKGDEPDWMSALYRIDDTSLYILPARASMRGSSELLSGARFADMIAGLRALPSEFVILCDLPPVFANDDTMLCAQKLDSYMLIVEHGRTTAAQVKESLALLEPTPCLGTILNRYQGGFVDDYGYGYGDPYGLKQYGKRE